MVLNITVDDTAGVLSVSLPPLSNTHARSSILTALALVPRHVVWPALLTKHLRFWTSVAAVVLKSMHSVVSKRPPSRGFPLCSPHSVL